MSIKGFESAEVKIVNVATGEEFIAEGMELSVDVAHEDKGYYTTYSSFPMTGTLNMTAFTLSGVSIARALGVQNRPTIKKLIYLHNKTNKKRIKKKLNERILDEICDIQFDLKEGRYK